MILVLVGTQILQFLDLLLVASEALNFFFCTGSISPAHCFNIFIQDSVLRCLEFSSEKTSVQFSKHIFKGRVIYYQTPYLKSIPENNGDAHRKLFVYVTLIC